MSNNWPRVSKSNPCPVCGKPDACKLSPDGAVCLCKRVEQGAFKSTKGWYFHRLNGKDHAADAAADLAGVRADNAWARKSHKAYSTPEAAIAAAGRTVEGGALAATWNYCDSAGREIMRVARFNCGDGRKQFRPVHCAGLVGWKIGDPPGQLPLYNLPALIANPTATIVVVEGEKCADAAISVGLLATTSAHGAESAERSDWRPLAGRDVAILPDADAPGEKYARDVARILLQLNPPARVRILRLAGLDEAGDIADWIEARDAADAPTIRGELLALVAAAPWLSAADALGGPVLVRMADIEARQVDWLWSGRIPLGRISLLVGQPGIGKSFLTTDMASRVSTGTPWPDGAECPAGSVILISAEDDPGDTLRPRLDAHRADCSRIHLLSMVRRIDADGKPSDILFSLENIAALEAALQAIPDCRLVIVDPIGSFIGGRTDAHRDNEVRAILAPVAQLAEKYGPAVLIVAHRRKAGGTLADDLALGSKAFTGIARVVWHLTRDRQNRARRLFLTGKNNLAAEGDGLAFTICGDPPALAWEPDPVSFSADDQLAEENGEDRPGPEPKARNAAADWLQALLDKGEVPAATVEAEAKAAGLNIRTVRRAADDMGVIREKNAFSGGWQWRFPKPAAQGDSPRGQVPPNAVHLSTCPLREINPASPRGQVDKIGEASETPRGQVESPRGQVDKLFSSREDLSSSSGDGEDDPDLAGWRASLIAGAE